MTKPSLMTDLSVICLELPLGLLGRSSPPVRSRLARHPKAVVPPLRTATDSNLTGLTLLQHPLTSSDSFPFDPRKARPWRGAVASFATVAAMV